MVRPIVLQESDFSDLALFQLSWRWTQEAHTRLLHHELQKIQPILPKVAGRIYRELEEAVRSHFEMPGQNFFSCGASSLDVAGLDREATANWINEQLPKEEGIVIVSWVSFGLDVAAVVQRDLFVKRWDDFCYPLSDDIDIWTPGLSFVLRYSRDEVFYFKTI
jgi:hypothetical protein